MRNIIAYTLLLVACLALGYYVPDILGLAWP